MRHMRTLAIPAFVVSVLSGAFACVAQSPRAFIGSYRDPKVESYDSASAVFLRSYSGRADNGVPLSSVLSYSAALSRDNRYLWLPNANHDDSFGGVYIIDTATGGVKYLSNSGDVTTGVVFSPDGKTAYVAAQPSAFNPRGGILVVNSASLRVTAAIPPPGLGAVFALAISPDGKRLYLSSKGDPHSFVSVFDTVTLAMIANIPVAAVQLVPGPPLALSPDGTKLFVSCATEVDAIDTRSLAVTARLLSGFVGPFPSPIAISPDGARLFAAAGGTVYDVNTATGAISRSIAIGESPEAIAITPDGKSVWAVGRSIITLDTASYAVRTYPPEASYYSFIVFDNPPRTLDFAPPGLTAFRAQDIGNTQIGAAFTATTTFTISAAGIKFNPFGNQTSQPKTNELDVFVYQMIGNCRGHLLASGSLCRNGPCPQTALFPSNGYPGTPVFFDVPLNFTFLAGQTYLVEFGVKPNGWGYGLTAKNWVEFYNFDPSFANTPPSKGGSPFSVGPARVLDGAFGADLQNKSLAHIRLVRAGE